MPQLICIRLSKPRANPAVAMDAQASEVTGNADGSCLHRRIIMRYQVNRQIGRAHV